jgi:hypothetical protein
MSKVSIVPEEAGQTNKYKKILTEVAHKRYLVATVTKLTVRINNLKIQSGYTVVSFAAFFMPAIYDVLCYGQWYRRVEKPTAFSTLSGIVNPVPVYLYSINNEKDRFNTSKVGGLAYV